MSAANNGGVAIVSESDLLELLNVLDAAETDIREHLQVARYNLDRGVMHTGDKCPIPNPPQLIHDAGIQRSEEVRDMIKKEWRRVFATVSKLQAERAKRATP